MIWKEAVIAYLKYYLGICLRKLKKTVKNLSQESWLYGQDLNLGPPKYHGAWF
jgi:hypothetical protein